MTALATPRRRRAAEDRLRVAVEGLPRHTKAAMLVGVVEEGRIIAGAYADRRGGTCPMLAAHRRGGRANCASFAAAWDAFTGARSRHRAATDAELSVLRRLLEQSLDAEPAEPAETVGVPVVRGWSWLRAYRRFDEYDAALRTALDEAGAGDVELPAEHSLH